MFLEHPPREKYKLPSSELGDIQGNTALQGKLTAFNHRVIGMFVHLVGHFHLGGDGNHILAVQNTSLKTYHTYVALLCFEDKCGDQPDGNRDCRCSGNTAVLRTKCFYSRPHSTALRHRDGERYGGCGEDCGRSQR